MVIVYILLYQAWKEKKERGRKLMERVSSLEPGYHDP